MASVLAVSPVMRLLQGDAFSPQTTDMQGNPMTVKTGVNAGQPTQSFVLTCGVAKTDPEAIPFILKLCGIAATAKPKFWPNGVKTPAPNFAPSSVADIAKLFGCTHPQYALKIQDGDGSDGNGASNASKEGFAGHWIFKFSQPSAPKVYEVGQYADMQRVDIDKARHSLLKRGFFIRIGAQVSDNENETRPGLYMNPAMVEIVRAGPEIVSGPDAGSVFGAGGVVNYAGVTGTVATPPPPAAPAGLVAAPGIDLAAYRASGWTDDQLVQAGHATRPAPAPATPPPPPAPATPPPPPYTGYRDAAAPPPPAPAKQMTAAAQGLTYEQYIASGWDDAMLIQHGMMVPN